jgi:hypothetical protein
MRLAVMLVLTAFGLVAAGCDSQQRDLLARALQQPVNDARLDMSMAVTQGGGDLFTATSNGPRALPSFDFTIDLGLHTLGDVKGEKFEAISSGEDVFVVYDGVTYDVGKDRVAAYMRRSARQAKKIGAPRTLGDFKRLGLNLESWFPNSKIVGDESFHGEQVTHLHGDIDVGALFADFSRFVAKNSLGNGRTRHLTPNQMRQLSKAVTNPTFDVLVDKATGGFRSIAAQAGIDVPDGPHLGMQMRVDFLDVGHAQTITAPSGGEPIGDLLDLLKQKYGAGFGAPQAATTS